MKYLEQTLQSSLFLLGGLAVLTFSLHFTNVQQTMAAANIPSPAPTPNTLLDSQMPGTLPYFFDRVSDKITLWQEEDDLSRVEKYIQYASHRTVAAQYAFTLSHYDESVTTLTKAFGYFARVHMLCQGFNEEAPLPCHTIQPKFETALETFLAVTDSMMESSQSDAVRMKIQHISEQAKVFAQ